MNSKTTILWASLKTIYFTNSSPALSTSREGD